MIEVYVGSSHSPGSNMGGWGVVLVAEGAQPNKYSGSERDTTQMAMILRAAIEGLGKTPQDSEVRLSSNAEYLIVGMRDSRRRKANRELWEQLDELANRRHVDWQLIRGSNKWLKEAQMLAKERVGT